MSVLGIDIGFGYTKVFTKTPDREVKIIFPSHVHDHQPQSGGFEPQEFVSVNGSSYLVGRQVTQAGLTPQKNTEPSFFCSQHYFALLGQAVWEVVKAVRSPAILEDLTVVLGVPPEAYGGGITEEMRQKVLAVHPAIHTTSGKVMVVNPARVFLVPQGMGAWIAHLAESQNPAELLRTTAVVIDIGYYTADFILVVNGHFAYEKARSYPLGVSYLYEKVKALMAKQHFLFISDETAERLLSQGRFTHFGRTYEVDTSPARDTFKKALINSIRAYSQEISTPVDAVYLCGGGIHHLGEFSGAEVIREPQFANARGYFHYGFQQVK